MEAFGRGVSEARGFLAPFEVSDCLHAGYKLSGFDSEPPWLAENHFSALSFRADFSR